VIATVAQRWRARRDSYRPAGEPIDTRRYEVAPIAADGPAKAFVVATHYSASYPAARFRFGLYRRGGELVGVAVVSHPARESVLDALPGAGLERAELGRLVLLDDVPANGETWFLGRCFELLRRAGLVGLVSHSDPAPRTTASNRVIFCGHLGVCYQAHNAVYAGRGTSRTLRLLPDGSVLSARAISKVRARERGWRYSAAILERFGASPLSLADDAKAWLARWVPALTRPMRHPGNYRYLWAIDRRARRHLPASLPYPKVAAPVQTSLF
jgi:hypothetical protein